MSKRPITNDPSDYAFKWFFVLEKARMDGDFKRAAYAQGQLERLDVKVRFGKRYGQTAAKGGAA
jgi:hypothetical protein